jgi:hypothetical protein
MEAGGPFDGVSPAFPCVHESDGARFELWRAAKPGQELSPTGKRLFTGKVASPKHQLMLDEILISCFSANPQSL